jgi:hypothetical protein
MSQDMDLLLDFSTFSHSRQLRSISINLDPSPSTLVYPHTPSSYFTSEDMHKQKHLPKHAPEMNIQGLPELQANNDLWYKIHVLLHDLCNIATDRAAESRTLATTDELYISAPYFTTDEAALVKSTKILPPTLNEIPEFEQLEYEQNNIEEAASPADLIMIEEATSAADSIIVEEATSPADLINIKEATAPSSLITIEEAIKSCLVNFFEKRRASGDARPCGPHDMGPIYLAVFGISKGELKDEKFLSRLRRTGLPRLDVEETRKVDEQRKAARREERKVDVNVEVCSYTVLMLLITVTSMMYYLSSVLNDRSPLENAY